MNSENSRRYISVPLRHPFYSSLSCAYNCVCVCAYLYFSSGCTSSFTWDSYCVSSFCAFQSFIRTMFPRFSCPRVCFLFLNKTLPDRRVVEQEQQEHVSTRCLKYRSHTHCTYFVNSLIEFERLVSERRNLIRFIRHILCSSIF